MSFPFLMDSLKLPELFNGRNPLSMTKDFLSMLPKSDFVYELPHELQLSSEKFVGESDKTWSS